MGLSELRRPSDGIPCGWGRGCRAGLTTYSRVPPSPLTSYTRYLVSISRLAAEWKYYTLTRPFLASPFPLQILFFSFSFFFFCYCH
ncbi:hypothetical protein LY76DRAFT_378176 [Colletotrichum caudatum]|nr:hypothetical protein LY76DRAFT_378176 [Colletotrichum caudatum]